MHIPDGFLSMPVWATMDVVAAPAIALVARRAQRDFEESRVALLGVLGAFVFAAQMINFPVGPGTTSHLVGGALLSFTLGPAAASVVMTAILVIQALIFQDGGVLALGANVTNMALVGVAAGYLPFALWGRGKHRKMAMFTGGSLSLLASAVLAISELLLSGVRMRPAVLATALALFVVSAMLEGAITVSVMQALEGMQPRITRPGADTLHAAGSRVLAIVSLAAVFLASLGVLVASTAPDGIQRLGDEAGITARVRTLLHTPFTNYHLALVPSNIAARVLAGLAGIALVFGACLLVGRAVARNRSL